MSEAPLRGKAAIIGIGQSPVGNVPGRSPLWLAADAARKTIADAGLKKSAIDGVLSPVQRRARSGRSK
jgi:acetyl-CoA acetyltransferase